MQSIDYDNNKLGAALALKTAMDTGNVYFYLGKSTPWTNEPIEDVPVDNDTNIKQTKANILYMAKVNAVDSQAAIKKVQYQTGVVYTQYSVSATDLEDKNFFVVTVSNNVYKCISNNNGALSTVQPTGTSVNPLITADGYTWKFMYNIPSSYLTKFQHPTLIAVPTVTDKTPQQLLVEQAAVEGANTPLGGHGRNAASELKAKRLIVTKTVNLVTNPELVSLATKFRQFGLIYRPMDINGNLLTADNYVIDVDSTNGTTVNMNSGLILNVTNIEVIDSSVDNQITVEFVLEF